MSNQPYDPYDDAYNTFRNAESFHYAPSQKTPAVNPGMSAAEGGLEGAMSGNPYIAGGKAALSFYLAKQQQAQRNRELAKEGRVAGIAEPTDMVNQALARYMQAVS